MVRVCVLRTTSEGKEELLFCFCRGDNDWKGHGLISLPPSMAEDVVEMLLAGAKITGDEIMVVSEDELGEDDAE